MTTDDGWAASAEAWIADQQDGGDYGRKFVLDAPMLERIDARPYRRALDIGCGEGRFCRMMRARGVATIGVDPTERLLEEAARLDPSGDYRLGRAEEIPFDDASVDLVVSYLSLIDIPDYAQAIKEMTRVLVPGGTLLIANLTSFATAGGERGWRRTPEGAPIAFEIDHYLTERALHLSWRGISVVNHHRPLSAYMRALLENGLTLVHFDEPAPTDGPPETADRYRRAPWFLIMEWRKP